MKKYQLNKNDFIEEKEFSFIIINSIQLYDDYKIDIELLISYFNQEYKWDNMFVIDDVKYRIENNHLLFLLYYGEKPIGYVFYKEIDKESCFGYNLYITKVIERPKCAASWFYNRTCNIMLNTYDKIFCEIEDWNKVVFNLVEEMGYKEICM